ncbi:MAG: DUF192 domain-containing protein [Sulfitobacter sp.]|nr:DUF192 domain-containing protein [Sulfitobacter sp.]
MRVRALVLGLGISLCAAAGAFAQEACRMDTVHLRGDWGVARFSVEIADDPEEQARGLMFREKLPLSAGMLFVYERPRSASFWMRNTLIPLDMLFVDARGVVQKIHPQAIPRDETPIEGGEGVLAVLEINGGMAARLGITEGSVLRHPALPGDGLAWPCAEG